MGGRSRGSDWPHSVPVGFEGRRATREVHCGAPGLDRSCLADERVRTKGRHQGELRTLLVLLGRDYYARQNFDKVKGVRGVPRRWPRDSLDSYVGVHIGWGTEATQSRGWLLLGP